MRRLLVGLLLVIAMIGLGMYWGLDYEPTFYRQEVAVSPEVQKEASDQLLSTASALASAARRQGAWSAELTDEQINGWLAVDLPVNHGDLLPKALAEPRVRLKPHELMIACRYETGGVTTVLSLETDVYMAEPNVIAIRFRRLRSGAIPMPKSTILDALSALADDMNLRLTWTQAENDPVALVELPPLKRDRNVEYHLDTFELREGSVYFAGKTTPLETADSGVTPLFQLFP